MALHGVDGDQGTLQLEHLKQARNGDDLVLLLAGDCLLAEHQVLLTRPRRDQMQDGAALGLVATAPRGLAVDGDDLRPTA